MLMTETLYSLRKRSRSARWGRMSSWLRFHIFTGLVGPYLVLLHTSWKFNGLAGIVTALMITVVLSGVVGRYIYTAVPRTADGVVVEAAELERQIATAEADLQRWLAGRPEADQRLVQRLAALPDAVGGGPLLVLGRALSRVGLPPGLAARAAAHGAPWKRLRRANWTGCCASAGRCAARWPRWLWPGGCWPPGTRCTFPSAWRCSPLPLSTSARPSIMRPCSNSPGRARRLALHEQTAWAVCRAAAWLLRCWLSVVLAGARADLGWAALQPRAAQRPGRRGASGRGALPRRDRRALLCLPRRLLEQRDHGRPLPVLCHSRRRPPSCTIPPACTGC